MGRTHGTATPLLSATQFLLHIRVYVELFFHDNQAAVDWFQAGGGSGNGVNNSWNYGYAVDAHLGYPY